MNDFEKTVEHLARKYPYPPSPDLRLRKPAPMNWAMLRTSAALLLLVGFLLLAIPDIRARVLERLGIGAIYIILDYAESDGRPLRLSDLVGQTSLSAARAAVSYPLLAPHGQAPNRVYLQADELVIMLWLDGNRPTQALYQTKEENWYILKTTEIVTETTVAEAEAYWLNTYHLVQFFHEGREVRELSHFVDGNVLLWSRDGITYRLETGLSMNAALELANSLVPVPE